MAAVADWKLMLTAILGVFVAIASLLLIAWLFIKGAESTQKPQRLRRAIFAGLAALYACWMVFSVVEVILGKESTEVLLGLPVGIFWFGLFWKAASKARTSS